MKTHIHKNKTGFSLVELLFAIALLSVVLIGVIRLQISNLALTNTHNNEAKAHFLANQALEIVEGLGKASLSNETLYLSGSTTYSLSTTPSSPIDGIFERSLIAENTLANAYLVTANITWEDTTGEHEINVKRVIYE